MNNMQVQNKPRIARTHTETLQKLLFLSNKQTRWLFQIFHLYTAGRQTARGDLGSAKANVKLSAKDVEECCEKSE